MRPSHLVLLVGLLTPPVLGAPPRWIRWEAAPADCRIEVPTSLAQLRPLRFEPCPGVPGCMRAGAPWAGASGWGYGGRLSAVEVDGVTLVSITRSPAPGLWEAALFSDGRAIGAWRYRLPGSGCALGGPHLSAGGVASLVLIRASAENAPVVLTASARDLMTAPAKVSFGPPSAAVIPREVADRSGDTLVLWEHYGRFAVRDLRTGLTSRPEPGSQPYRYLQHPTPLDGSVYYWVWTGDRGSIWVSGGDGVSVPVLRDPHWSFDGWTVAEGEAVWTRSRGSLGINRFSEIALWTAPVGAGTRDLDGRQVASLSPGELPLVSAGAGWAAVRRGPKDVRLYRLRDGLERRLPAMAGLSFDGGPGGLALAGSEVWVKASLDGRAGNDARFILRFSLQELTR